MIFFGVFLLHKGIVVIAKKLLLLVRRVGIHFTIVVVVVVGLEERSLEMRFEGL